MSEKATYPTYCLTDFRNTSGPIIDVRSPGEFFQGHIPGAKNLPLFSDSERALIGKSYKKESRKKAIYNGLKITLPKIKYLQTSLAESASRQENSKNTLRIYCWRGGMRSGTLGWLAASIGIKVYILKDGYKTYRKWVLDQFEKDYPIRLLGGKTGTGKTDILKSINSKKIYALDLEGLANHRGSSFGSLGMNQQPTSHQFENLIAEQLDVFINKNYKEIWVEAESPNLGKCRIPNSFYKQMKTAPLLEIIKKKKERVDNLVNIYSKNSQADLKDAVLRIHKRLGSKRTSEALLAIDQRKWAEACIAMLYYYDKCYDYEIKKSQNINIIDISGLSIKLSIEKIFKEKLNTL